MSTGREEWLVPVAPGIAAAVAVLMAGSICGADVVSRAVAVTFASCESGARSVTGTVAQFGVLDPRPGLRHRAVLGLGAFIDSDSNSLFLWSPVAVGCGILSLEPLPDYRRVGVGAVSVAFGRVVNLELLPGLQLRRVFADGGSGLMNLEPLTDLGLHRSSRGIIFGDGLRDRRRAADGEGAGDYPYQECLLPHVLVLSSRGHSSMRTLLDEATTSAFVKLR